MCTGRVRVRIAKMDIKLKFHFFLIGIALAKQHDTYPKFLRDSFSLFRIFDGMKIAKILLHFDVHVQVRFLNLSIE